MDVAVIHERIRRKLSQGLLPAERPTKTWAGNGSGFSCSGCGRPIVAPQLEFEHDLSEGRLLRFHGVCDGLWRVEVRRILDAEGHAGNECRTGVGP